MFENLFKKRNLLLSNLLFGVISLIFLFINPSVSFSDANLIFARNNKAVVVVIAYNEMGKPIGQGSGFIVRSDGRVVTSYHVISNAKDIKIKLGSRTITVQGIVHIDKENDIVILKMKGKDYPTVKLGDFQKSKVGEKVYVISSPMGLENTISEGILSGIRELSSNITILQITAPISQGSSGGPVFNKDGEVIGLVSFLIKEAQNLNFALPLDRIKDKIGKKITPLKESEIVDFRKTAEYWAIFGYYYSEAGMHKEAIDSYKQAIRIKPDYEVAHHNLGSTYMRLGMYKEAIEVYKQAIRIKPDYVYFHYNLGVIYYKLGMYREAIDSYKQAIKIEPDLAEAHYNLGVNYRKLGMYREAIEAFKQAIRIKPDDADIHINLGASYGELGMYREAIESFKQAIRIKPDYAYAHYNLGIIYLILNDRGSALEVYKKLKNLDPELANKLFNLIYK